jgi:hypothetical protein
MFDIVIAKRWQQCHISSTAAAAAAAGRGNKLTASARQNKHAQQ